MKDIWAEPLDLLYKVLPWFFLLVSAMFASVVVWVRHKKNAARVYEFKHPDAVKVYLRRTMPRDHLRVSSVNGEKPVMHIGKTAWGFYLLPGKNVIRVAYQWAARRLVPLGARNDGMSSDDEEYTYVPGEEIAVTVKQGKEYSLCYNHVSKKYEFSENNAS